MRERVCEILAQRYISVHDAMHSENCEKGKKLKKIEIGQYRSIQCSIVQQPKMCVCKGEWEAVSGNKKTFFIRSFMI